VLISNLYVSDEAAFADLASRTGFTSGNISSHMTKLETAGYVEVTKTFVGKRPRTSYKLTQGGRDAFEQYRASVEGLLNAVD
jgi:DNA-binding MarR family transcriptional regulator